MSPASVRRTRKGRPLTVNFLRAGALAPAGFVSYSRAALTATRAASRAV
jgi:hypothetical protein